MLCRTSKLIHPASGVSLETPLLVPSFSSNAFGFGRDGKSEVLEVLEAAQEFITRTCLVSAYDVHYAYIPEPQDLSITVDLMFLDSGGYEVSNDRDLSAVEKPVHRPGDWDAAKLQAIWDRWPAGLPAVLVSYDHSNHRRSVTEQLRDAKQAVLAQPGQLHSFLLKPQAKEERINSGDSTEYSWPAQEGATLYEVARSTSPDFTMACTTFTSDTAVLSDPEEPLEGFAFYYRVRALLPYAGSWGRDSAGVEVTPVCGS